MTSSTSFETEVCSRCGGSGRFSFNLMTGDTCFKCRGKGNCYTKRGQVAIDYYRELLKVPVTELKIGDLIWCSHLCGPAGGFRAITKILTGPAHLHPMYSMAEPDRVMVTVYTEKSSHSYYSDQTVQKGWSGSEKADYKRMALEYQDTLLKSGKVAKSKR